MPRNPAPRAIRIAGALGTAIALVCVLGCPYPHPVTQDYCDGPLRYRTAVFSSDGEVIAADGCAAGVEHVDLLAPDGALIRRFPDENHSVWAPGAAALYVAAPSDGQLYRQPLDGAPRQRLTSSNVKSYPTGVSPDGAWIAVNRGRDVVLVAADGSREVLVAPGGSGAKWSPDGKLILYLHVEEMDAWVVRPDGAGARFSTAGEPISWTADGGSVLVMRSSPAGDGGRQLWAVPLDGQTPRLVLDRTSVAPAWGFDASRLWAPGGDRSIVATEHTTHVMRSGILLLDAQGSLQRDYRLDQPLVEFDPPAQASWRPDGAAVLYVQDRAIRLLELSTGESRVVAPIPSP